MHHPDICIAGAGIIGVSLAIELQHRGVRVTVLDQTAPLTEASTAAAGMLAAGDPANPTQLRTLAELSLSLYPDFLDRLHVLSGVHVPFQTHTTLQAVTPGGPGTSPELTPGELANILPALVPAASISSSSTSTASTLANLPPPYSPPSARPPSTCAPTRPSSPLAPSTTPSRSTLPPEFSTQQGL